MPYQPSSSRKEELSYRNNVINEIKRYLNVQLDSEATLPNPVLNDSLKAQPLV